LIGDFTIEPSHHPDKSPMTAYETESFLTRQEARANTVAGGAPVSIDALGVAHISKLPADATSAFTG